MGELERDILERSVHAIAEQAANTNKVIDEAMEAGLAADHPVTIAAKQVRLELLKVKADLERELGKLVVNCSPPRTGSRSSERDFLAIGDGASGEAGSDKEVL